MIGGVALLPSPQPSCLIPPAKTTCIVCVSKNRNTYIYIYILVIVYNMFYVPSG